MTRVALIGKSNLFKVKWNKNWKIVPRVPNFWTKTLVWLNLTRVFQSQTSSHDEPSPLWKKKTATTHWGVPDRYKVKPHTNPARGFLPEEAVAPISPRLAPTRNLNFAVSCKNRTLLAPRVSHFVCRCGPRYHKKKSQAPQTAFACRKSDVKTKKFLASYSSQMCDDVCSCRFSKIFVWLFFWGEIYIYFGIFPGVKQKK